MKLKFLSDETKINGITYKKGETINASPSIAERLIDSGDAQEVVETSTKNNRKSAEEE